MTKHSTHRATGPAHTPLTRAHRAAGRLGGAAVLGTVLVGTAFTGGAAHASDVGLADDQASSSSSQSAPAGDGSTGGTSAPASSSPGSGNAIVDTARSAIGTPFSWGGSSLSGMDCSGLVNYAYEAAGIDVPRTSGQIADAGRSISQSEAQPGDLVTWPGHVAIYAGDGKIIDASGSQQEVVERDIWGSPTGFVTYR